MKQRRFTSPVVLGSMVGGGLTIALILYIGAGSVIKAVATAGLTGLVVVILAHLPSLVLCGLAWRCLVPDAPCRASLLFVRARWIRDAASSLIPVLPISGELAAIRVLALQGMSRARAGASVVVDVTAEIVGQFLFTLFGLGLLVAHNPGDGIVFWVGAALLVSAPVVTAFVLLPKTGAFRWLENLSERIARSWNGDGLRGLHRGILITYAHRRRVLASVVLHFLAWIAGAAEAWAGFALLGYWLSVSDVLVIESLVYALRSVAFFVPSALGIQEGAYVFLGAMFGLPPDIALALSLLKRGREVALGAPGLAVWQWLESRRFWKRRQPAPPGSSSGLPPH